MSLLIAENIVMQKGSHSESCKGIAVSELGDLDSHKGPGQVWDASDIKYVPSSCTPINLDNL